MRAHPAGFEQLLQAGPEQLPVVIVLLSTIRAVHDNAAYSAGSQQSLVDGQIAQVSEQAGSLLIVERFVDAVVGTVQSFQRQSRILRIASEGVGGK
jgi:hypothetical protein